MRLITLGALGILLCEPANAMRKCCVAAQGEALLGRASPDEIVVTIRRDCDAGDVIGLPGSSEYVIRSVCDFSKSIYRAESGMALCVVKAQR
jgi:hypothetical protein